MGLGVTEILVLLVIVLIIFGAGKLPNVMGDLAKGIKNFKTGLKDEPESPPPPQPRIAPHEDARPVERTGVPSGQGETRP